MPLREVVGSMWIETWGLRIARLKIWERLEEMGFLGFVDSTENIMEVLGDSRIMGILHKIDKPDTVCELPIDDML